MAARPVWKGQLRLSLVSIPVEMYSATKTSARVRFRQIHEPSGKPVRYQKTVPGVGPVDAGDIMKGYEYEKDQYLLIDPEDVDEIKLETKKTLELVQFVDACEISPLYFNKPYYLVPTDDLAEDAYRVVRDALRSTKMVGIGQVTMRGKEYLVAVKPCGDGLLLETLHYAEEIRDADPLFSEIEDDKADEELLEVAKSLIERKTGAFKADAFKDNYSIALKDLIDRKTKSKSTKRVQTDDSDGDSGSGDNVIDLMAALKQSLAKADGKSSVFRQDAQVVFKNHQDNGQEEVCLMSVTAEKLSAYVAKRDFSKTSEPEGGSSGNSSQQPAFVVQKHDARRLHYDFRLEWEGVLLSWAVTKGPSAVTSVKRLAVRTEDHPLSYGSFEGTIPAKQYGAGTVMLWDEGWWEPQEDFAKGLKSGKLKFILHGQRMKGRWTLVRMRTKEKRENWLLIKEHDSFEEEEENGLIERHVTSVSSARSMEEIAEGKVARKQPAKAARQKRGKTTFTLPTPRFRKPQLAKLDDHVPRGDGWLHETKFDGYRCLAALGRGGVKLYTRSGLDWTERYAGLPEAFSVLDCRNALIDGEVVSASKAGGSSFSALQADLEKGRPVVFMAFDLLELNGDKLIKQPLTDRKEALSQLLSGLPKNSPVRYSDHVVGHGEEVFQAVEKAGGEGIISKACDSTYAGNRSGSWLKIKTKRRQEFIVGGFSPSKAKHRPFASLLVGTRENGELHYRGRVGSGFGDADLDKLNSLMRRRELKNSPFADVPADVARSARWLKPELVVEVEYAELTDQGSLRHGVFQGVREDKEAAVVKLEKTDKLGWCNEDGSGGTGKQPRPRGVSRCGLHEGRRGRVLCKSRRQNAGADRRQAGVSTSLPGRARR